MSRVQKEVAKSNIKIASKMQEKQNTTRNELNTFASISARHWLDIESTSLRQVLLQRLKRSPWVV